MNARGEIVGLYTRDERSSIGIWRWPYDEPRWIADTGTGPGQGNMINNRGDVLSNEWYWHGGAWQELTDPTRRVITSDLNNAGDVVGELSGNGDLAAFIWRDGRFTEIRSPDGRTSAHLVNDRGDVVGTLYRSPESSQPFIWRDGVMTPIDPPAHVSGWPMALNERGQILFNGDYSAVNHPHVWSDGRMTDLLAGQPKREGYAMAMNDRGDVVGNMDSKPVLWRDGRTIPLPLPAATGWTGSARVINARGDVGGVATLRRGNSTYFYVALWRNGRIAVAPLLPDADEGLDVTMAGITARGWVAGTFSNAVDRRVAIWYPVRATG
jgi:hypothetical protein